MPDSRKPLLALDTGSPLVSVAVGIDGRVLASREISIERSSEMLLGRVDEVLTEARIAISELGGVLALRGPGSFTGLRVGLATVLGLHQALGIPVTALPTLQVLAMLAPEGDDAVVAVVDALREEWFAQEFMWNGGSPPRALAPARIVSKQALNELAPGMVVGFGVERLAPTLPNARLVPATALAEAALRFAALETITWDPDLLTAPLYLRAPAVTPQS